MNTRISERAEKAGGCEPEAAPEQRKTLWLGCGGLDRGGGGGSSSSGC
jgi:hypothetical protein